mmetsp:Transcript_18777/g.51631  ORF Transcript_18777/g.51631 Transcript_18777/m.51631 type:complete len:218 (+) Transcript_18777:1381-2034(+)
MGSGCPRSSRLGTPLSGWPALSVWGGGSPRPPPRCAGGIAPPSRGPPCAGSNGEAVSLFAIPSNGVGAGGSKYPPGNGGEDPLAPPYGAGSPTRCPEGEAEGEASWPGILSLRPMPMPPFPDGHASAGFIGCGDPPPPGACAMLGWCEPRGPAMVWGGADQSLIEALLSSPGVPWSATFPLDVGPPLGPTLGSLCSGGRSVDWRSLSISTLRALAAS